MAAFAVGWGGTPWIYPSEIFPMDIKEKAMSTSVASQWVANFAIAYIVPQQVKLMGSAGTFAFYSVTLAIFVVIVFVMVPETKGLEMEQMEALFGGVQSAREVISNRQQAEYVESGACTFHSVLSVKRPRSETAPFNSSSAIELEAPAGLGGAERQRSHSYQAGDRGRQGGRGGMRKSSSKGRLMLSAKGAACML
eukprot:TRINITY_DN8368_c0_g1_i1.p2 TRINITY_DN8368_c0_g1~~TRINITY_DN8368_c0_g1_i1.p2  ORF type:complete len:195 (-),score=49.63 TRINITY_DN8368_c0_g1_i1:407-991(-)